MFFSEHRLKMTSLRIGKHRIVKNIASLRKVNIAHPSLALKLAQNTFFCVFVFELQVATRPSMLTLSF